MGLHFRSIVLGDNDYPKNLTNIYDPPKVLYIKGTLEERDNKAIAIVGTRKPSYYGLEVAKRFAYELAGLGITIVSGMALGIDTAAHIGALEAKGRTIAVLGYGLDFVGMDEDEGLVNKICSSGALVSELPSFAPPAKWTFPRRNRIISGLSVGVIIVEGGYKSGAMITAKLALDQGREVFAVPGNIDSELSKGPHWLIKQGAKLVEAIDDILEELQHVLGIPASFAKEMSLNKNNNIDLSMLTIEEQIVYKELSRSPIHIDEVVQKTKLEISQVLVLLSQMEIKRFVKQMPGKMFVVASF